MNGIHDMGGMHGLGPIRYEKDEPVFHAEWEARVWALTRVLRLGPPWNIHMSRYTMEQLPPATYLSVPYYQRWLLGLERRLVGSGVLSAEELADGRPRPDGVKLHTVTADEVRASAHPWRAPRDAAGVPPKFTAGDQVVARTINPRSHTRLPRYVRGHRGVIDRDLGLQDLPDIWVTRQEAHPEHVYSVRFVAQELWGPDASPRDAVFVDLWDDYLDPA